VREIIYETSVFSHHLVKKITHLCYEFNSDGVILSAVMVVLI
jgi:hypothetical protein